jgi:hypothetical protein
VISRYYMGGVAVALSNDKFVRSCAIPTPNIHYYLAIFVTQRAVFVLPGTLELTCISYVSAGMVALAPSPGTDWTHDERAQIDRLEALCRTRDYWEPECRHTDAGDPWCIIYDRHQHRIVLHIARIERRYIVVWPALGRSDKRATIEGAVEIALTELVSMA